MSWSLFAIIQLSVTAAGIVVAFWLRNRQLKKHLATMETAQDEAREALSEAKTKLESIEERSEWLKGRITALDGDDPVTVVQRMVLQNESKPKKSFNNDLSAQLGGGSNIEEIWRELRTSQHELATKLISGIPSQHSSIVKLYDVFSALDETFPIGLPDLPEAEEGSEDQSGDEQLRLQNQDLQGQLESAREALLTASEGDAEGDDLKSLLQQFTRDSRDMMICIEMLEAENLQLRSRLDSSKSANLDAPSEPTEKSSEAPAGDPPPADPTESATEIDDADIEAILASVANDDTKDAA